MTIRTTIPAIILAALATLVPASAPATAQDAASATPSSGLTLTVTGISKTQGRMTIGVFDAEGYETGAATTGAEVDVTAETLTVSFEALAPGEYGIKLFHDVNGNDKMDTNPFGAPTEPYAFSNNAKGRFGPAKWDAARFTVDEDGTVHIISME